MESNRGWIYDSDYILWMYDIQLSDGQMRSIADESYRNNWLCERLLELQETAREIGTLKRVSISSGKLGDDALVLDGPRLDHIQTSEEIRNTPCINCAELDITLNIKISNAQGKEELASIERGIIIYLFINVNENCVIELKEGDTPVYISVHLNTDVYSYENLRAEDNTQTARLNAPALERFLHKLEQKLNLSLTEFSGEGGCESHYVLRYPG